MKNSLQLKLDRLRVDYQNVKGFPFNNFFCPILFCDEDAPLIEGHIINQAFPKSSRKWTVQRNDVDTFYGSCFEADFVAIKYKENQSIGKALIDKKQYKALNPKFYIDDKPVEHFVPKGRFPGHSIPVLFENDDGETIFLGLKISPEEFKSSERHKIELEVSVDVRICALVSLIKAAHLTLFEMIGYHYALSAGGYFVGWEILGKFYDQNRNKSKAEILKNAKPYFREFAHMLRPVQTLNLDAMGTITDRLLYLCNDPKGIPWAKLVLVRISTMMHAVMIPILDQPEKAERFFNFLRNDNEYLDVTPCQYNRDHWNTTKETTRLFWPKSGILFPED